VGFFDPFIKQIRKPTGLLGSLMARAMNLSHSKLTNWGLSHIQINNDYTILDVGCGGGRTVNKLAKIANMGKVYGIDYSDESVRVSRKRNKKFIKGGRVHIQKGNVSSLPYSDDYFELITGIESYYYWPDLGHDMKEILRVLKPGGTLIIIGGLYKNSKFDERHQKFVKKLVKKLNMHYHSPEELDDIFSKAGYKDIKIVDNYEKGRICGYGKKPVSL
jgi:ubiquinone/menaquinone biosynthesis C-methylase UbiE